MEISSPRRILCVGASDSGVLTLLKDLTGSAPEQVDDTTAGLSHAWTLKTSYYTAELPIWIDEIASVPEWRAQFLEPEAKEVVRALGAWIYCFKKPVNEAGLRVVEETLAAIQKVVEKAWGFGWEGVCLAVAMPQGLSSTLVRSAEEWEDLCREKGFEYVDAEAKGRNEYGEPVGVPRIREALEANDWAGDEGGEDDFEDLDDFGDVEGEGEWHESFAAEEAQMGLELMGMKAAINGGEEAAGAAREDGEVGGAEEVEELERMMGKMLAIRDMAAGLPEEQRKKFAAKAVNDIMKSS